MPPHAIPCLHAISQRCDHDDEHEFRGLLTFADHSMEGIRDGFEQLSALPASQRVRMAVQREQAFHDRFVRRLVSIYRPLASALPVPIWLLRSHRGRRIDAFDRRTPRTSSAARM
jgi:hypothetical protein